MHILTLCRNIDHSWTCIYIRNVPLVRKGATNKSKSRQASLQNISTTTTV